MRSISSNEIHLVSAGELSFAQIGAIAGGATGLYLGLSLSGMLGVYAGIWAIVGLKGAELVQALSMTGAAVAGFSGVSTLVGAGLGWGTGAIVDVVVA